MNSEEKEESEIYLGNASIQDIETKITVLRGINMTDKMFTNQIASDFKWLLRELEFSLKRELYYRRGLWTIRGYVKSREMSESEEIALIKKLARKMLMEFSPDDSI